MTEWKEVTGLPERKSSWRPVWVARPGPGLPRLLWLSLSSVSWGQEASSRHTLAQLTRLPFRISCNRGVVIEGHYAFKYLRNELVKK